METRLKIAEEEKDLQNSTILKTISNILNEIIIENKENSNKDVGKFYSLIRYR